MTTKTKNKNTMNIKSILRWIALLPAAVAGALLAYNLTKWIQAGAYIRYVDINSYTIFGVNILKIVIELMASAFMGVAFVYIGAFVAPKYKRVVAIVFAVIMAIIALVALYFAFFVNPTSNLQDNIMYVLTNIAAIAGAIGAVFVWWEKTEDEEE